MPVETTDKYVRVRVKDPDNFQEGSFRTITISKDEGIRAVIGRPEGKDTTEVQAYLFDKKKWTEKRAKKWVEKHKKGKEGEKAVPFFEVEGAWYVEVDEDVLPIGDVLKAYLARHAPEPEQDKPTPSPYAVKMLREQDGGAVVGGPMVLWGDAKRKDMQGEYFTPETKTWHDVYQRVPALFHHGLDDTVGLSVVGHRIKAEPRDVGLWVEDWLDMSSEYWAFIKPLLDAEALYYSPGSAPHLVKCAEDGRLESYPIVEDTLTPIPAQHRLRPIEQIKAAYKAAGIELPELPEPEPAATDGGGDGGPSRQEVERARAKAEATLSYIDSL